MFSDELFCLLEPIKYSEPWLGVLPETPRRWPITKLEICGTGFCPMRTGTKVILLEGSKRRLYYKSDSQPYKKPTKTIANRWGE